MGVAAFQRRSIMDQSNHRLVSGNLPLGRLVGNALGEIKQLGYSRRSLDRYRAIWRHLIEFSCQNKLGDEFSGNLAACFVEEYRVGDEEVDKQGEGWRRHIVFGVKALGDLATLRRTPMPGLSRGPPTATRLLCGVPPTRWPYNQRVRAPHCA